MRTLRANFSVVRRGRKRKPGPRHPCGDLIEEKTDPKVVAFPMPHRQGAPEHLRHDPKAATEFGVLSLTGLISDDQYDAGERYGKDVARYRSIVISAPKENPGSIAGFSEPRAGSGEITEETAIRIRETFDGAFEALNAKGNRVLRTVNHAVIHNKRVEPEYIPTLRLGLDALHEHYVLTNQRKRGS